MSIEYATHGTDIFELPVQCIVNPTNARGVSGKGLALAFKKRWPHVAGLYQHFCDVYHQDYGEWPIGFAYPVAVAYEDGTLWDSGRGPDDYFPHFVIAVPTKNHWRDPAKIDYVEKGLVALDEQMRKLKLASVALPALGCGLGGLSFETVKPIFEKIFANANYHAIVIPPRE